MKIDYYLSNIAFRLPKKRNIITESIIKKAFPIIIMILIIGFLTMQSFEGTSRLTYGAYDLCKIIFSDSSARWTKDMHWFRTLAHIPLYFFLGCVVCLQVNKSGKSVVICSLVAFTDEALKILLPTREFGLLDLFFDAIGFLNGIILVMLFRWLKKCKRYYKS
jgi:VanZ family protein